MPGEVTILLRRLREGERDAEEQLISAVYGELKLLARMRLRGVRGDHTLQPTALVHEAYLKLTHGDRIGWQDRAHFFRAASQAMRQIVVDHARERLARKRGGGAGILTLDEELVAGKGRPGEIVALDEALDRLRQQDPRVYDVVEMKFFGGLSVEETAKAMGLSSRTVKRDWRMGRAWLRGELQRGGLRDAGSLGAGKTSIRGGDRTRSRRTA